MSDRRIEVVTVTPNPAVDVTLTIPRFAAGVVNRVERQHAKPGGKGVNVAAALADYGHAVAVTGFLGRDNAATFEALFAAKQIADRFVRTDGETRSGIKIFDPALEQTTDINFPGQSPAPGDADALRQRLHELAADAQPWFVLAGSLPPSTEPGLYRDLARTLKAVGCRVLVDTSGEPLRLALEAGPQVIKPNIHELESLLGARLNGRREVAEAARALLSAEVELVAVSMGGEGALFVDGEQTILAVPPSVQVRSTVGAGDAMVAGILAGRLAGLSLAATARLATAFALDALTRDESAHTSRLRINAFAGEVTIHDFSDEL